MRIDASADRFSKPRRPRLRRLAPLPSSAQRSRSSRRRRRSSIPATSSATSMLTDVADRRRATDQGSFVSSRSLIVGKVARRTLLPGHADPALRASTQPQARRQRRPGQADLSRRRPRDHRPPASALQDGSIGDMIKVRNDDSGVTVVRRRPGRRLGQGERRMMRRCFWRSRFASARRAGRRRRSDQGRLGRCAACATTNCRLWPGRRPARHRRHLAQRALHRAVRCNRCSTHGHQRARRVAAQPQCRRRHRHRRSARRRRRRARASTSPSPRSAMRPR